MYGTIGRFQPKPGQAGRVDELSRRWLYERAPRVEGFVGEYVLIPAARPDERLALAIFDSKESYERNARDPEQDRWYRELRDALLTDPEWTDGEIAALQPATVPL